ncbi:hypothetical protein X777_06933, partial [Ooceraea biroi]
NKITMESESSVDSDLFDAAISDQGILFDGTFFEKLSTKSTSTTTVAVCKKCSSSNVEIKGYKRCTSNFLKHLKRKHDCVEEYKTLGRRLKKYYDKQVLEIKELLKKVNYICTTVDIWSDRKRSFLGVTAHWIDPITLKRKSRALACRRFSRVHNFQRITELLQEIHQAFGLDPNKIVATIHTAPYVIRSRCPRYKYIITNPSQKSNSP